MRQWTTEARAKQAQLIHRWKPWLKAGVKTEQGKNISKMNAYKHGGRSAEARYLKRMITECKKLYPYHG